MNAAKGMKTADVIKVVIARVGVDPTSGIQRVAGTSAIALVGIEQPTADGAEGVPGVQRLP